MRNVSVIFYTLIKLQFFGDSSHIAGDELLRKPLINAAGVRNNRMKSIGAFSRVVVDRITLHGIIN